MLRTKRVGTGIARLFVRLMSVVLMIAIGAVQAVGTILTALSALVLKGISVLMISVTILMLIFGLFSWTKTLVVLGIAGCMFWLPEFLAAVVFGLAAAGAKLLHYMNA